MRSRFFTLVSAAFLLFVILSAVRIGIADVLSNRIRGEMNDWSLSGIQPDSNAMEHVSRMLAIAKVISPGNPDHFEDAARLVAVRSAIVGITSPEHEAQLAYGISQIRRAIALRPLSPYSWATLLLLKRERAEYDAEFRHALERTVTLGPWEPEVQPIVADVGLSAWADLPEREQEMVRMNFMRGMKRQSQTMIAIANSHQQSCIGSRAHLAGCLP